MIELRTLGVTQVLQLGSPDSSFHLQPKRLAVLAYLAAARPRGMHRRDSLLVMFWPDENEQRARNALSQTVHAIRRDIGQQVLVTQGHELIGVDPANLSCDAVEFEERLDRDELDEALRLYRGEFPRASRSVTRWASIAGRRAKLGDCSDAPGRPPNRSPMRPKQAGT